MLSRKESLLCENSHRLEVLPSFPKAEQQARRKYTVKREKGEKEFVKPRAGRKQRNVKEEKRIVKKIGGSCAAALKAGRRFGK